MADLTAVLREVRAEVDAMSLDFCTACPGPMARDASGGCKKPSPYCGLALRKKVLTKIDRALRDERA